MPRVLIVACLLVFASVTAGQAQPASGAPPIAFHERTLANGLKVITTLDRSTPNVTVQVWYGVGAKNDPEGRSGFAHLFEHMMFKATRDMPPEYLDRLTEDVGGTNNAFTADDTTAFYEVIPSAQLQRLLWAEADRMSSLVVDKANFDSERQVVEEELRQRVLADPYGRFSHYLIPESTFAVHPYRRSAIGSIEDLDAATLDDVQRFHATFYRPDNAVLVVAGNFDPAQVDAWVDRYFGPLKDPAAPIPRINAVEPPRLGPKEVTGYGPDVPLPAVAITWLAPSASSPDAAALSVLDAILAGGKSSRLYDSLVYDKQMAAQVFSDADLRQQLGMYYVGAIVAAGHTPDEVIGALRAQVAALREAPPTANELEIAKTQLLTTAIRQRETIDGVAEGLASAQVIEGDASKANSDLDDLAKVTGADVENVAQLYLADDERVVIRYLAESQRPAGTAPPPIAPPPAPSVPYTGPVAVLLPPDQRQVPPAAGPQAPAVLPAPSERTLPNGLRVIVARSTDLPLVAARLVIVSGASSDPAHLAGDANLTANLVTEGTASRSARDIARESEALGADLSSGSSSDASQVTLSVMPSKLPAALAIVADAARHPVFAEAELDRTRKQQLDDLDVAYGDPGQVAGFATAAVAYAGTPYAHTEGGAPTSLKRLTRDDLVRFHATHWRPDNAILVLTGDITPQDGFALAASAFGDWPVPASALPPQPLGQANATPRDIAIDLPGAGQAAVVVVKPGIARGDPRYFAGVVANAVLGGGYSARLNDEIRVRRGLSYGADSALSAHRTLGAFTAEAQTRNDAAVEVAGLIKAEMSSLAEAPATPEEIAARKSSLIGDYGRYIETATGLGAAISDLAIYRLDLADIAAYPGKVEAVTSEQAQAFARDVLQPAGASTIVVGDTKQFLDALKLKSSDLDVIPIADFDPDAATLREGP